MDVNSQVRESCVMSRNCVVFFAINVTPGILSPSYNRKLWMAA